MVLISSNDGTTIKQSFQGSSLPDNLKIYYDEKFLKDLVKQENLLTL